MSASLDVPVLVTGAAGFIGYHAARRLLDAGREVVGVDSFTDYYDPALKEARFSQLQEKVGFVGTRLDLADGEATRQLFDRFPFRVVLHLAAQPGVRYALTHPHVYASANVTAFLNVLEASRHAGVQHLVYASSSSVYGGNMKLPFAEGDPVDYPISLYAATKRSNELMAHSYAHLFGLPCTGLRFFTVYGPWGRPDMAIYRFTDRIARGEAIEVAAAGQVLRSFTFIDDATEAVFRVLQAPAPRQALENSGPGTSAFGPFRLFNIGGDRPSDLNRVIGLIENGLGRPAAARVSTVLPAGDIVATSSDVSSFSAAYGCVPATPLEVGIPRFVAWYTQYHGARREA